MKRSLLGELKRRNVLRAAALYLASAWLIAQIVTQLFPLYSLPAWTMRWVIGALAFGFPFWIAFAWFYELTPEGLKLESQVDPSESITHLTGRKFDFWIIVILTIAVVLLLTNTFVWREGAGLHTAESEPVSARSIAVLPFENLSNDKANDYFVAGIQDLILTKLADIGELKVISRISTAKYASRPDNLKAIGEDLGVANVLEGSVQKAGNSVLVNVQLINAATDSHIWAQAYTRTLDNVFGVEGEVAGKVAEALKAKLVPEETHRLATELSKDPAANDLLLRADYLFHRGRINGDPLLWRQSIPLYRQAIAKQPDFALARARLSYAESLLGWYGGAGDDVKQLGADARVQADQALKLAPDLAEAYLAVGYCDYYGQGDYAAALKSFAAALAARPNYDDALAARGYVLRRQFKLDEGIAALQQALALDPNNRPLSVDLGDTFVTAGRFREAEQAYRKVLEQDPDNTYVQVRCSRAIFGVDHDAARALAVLHGDDPSLRQERVGYLAYQHNYREALAQLDAVPDTPENFSPGQKALQEAGLQQRAGDDARARELYAKALSQIRTKLDHEVDDIQLAGTWNAIADAELGLGRTDEALQALGKSLNLSERSNNRTNSQEVGIATADLYARAGRADKALPLAARVLEDRPEFAVGLWTNDDWDTIRDDPGFKVLLNKYEKYRPKYLPGAAAN